MLDLSPNWILWAVLQRFAVVTGRNLVPLVSGGELRVQPLEPRPRV